jgi:choline dehydrogenase-like flavoprotein
MPRVSRAEHAVLGNRRLSRFDVCIIGSGAGGASVAHVLTEAGKSVLVLEAGDNAFPGLDRRDLPFPLHSNDELKYVARNWIGQDPLLEPRTFRIHADQMAMIHDNVNVLPRAVGGGFQHADCKTPRFNAVDFRLKSTMEALIAATPGLAVPGFGADSGSASFVDWAFTYDELEPYYVEAEHLYGVQGMAGSDPFASPRSASYPMDPGVVEYSGVLLGDGAQKTQLAGEPLHPHPFPTAINSRPYDGRPACVDCGYCGGWGCPNNSKNAPAVTTLRRALLTGRCQLRFHAMATRLVNDGGHVHAVEYVDADGAVRTATADAFVLAASAIESARLCFLSPTPAGGVLGNSSDMVGRNLMFHFQTTVGGFMPQKTHGYRGRAGTTAICDFRGVEPGGASIRVVDDGGTKRVFMGGIVEMGASDPAPISSDGSVYAFQLSGLTGTRFGQKLKDALRDAPLMKHVLSLLLQSEDAPQPTNRIDLDPTVRDIFGLPVPRVTYINHAYEQEARSFYIQYMLTLLENAGARTFVAPCGPLLGDPPSSAHLMGTLRMGTDPASSVVDPNGRFWDIDNLYSADGAVFPTASGYNPTLTICAVALRTAHGMVGTKPA